MKRVPPTISRTLDLIERRRVYTLHMLALQNQKPIVENDPEEPPTAVETRQKKRRYYREMEYHFGEENLAYIRQFKKSRDSEHANAATMYGKRSPRRYNFALNYRNRILFDDDSEDGRSTVNNDDDASETSEQILERLGLESGMTVYDRAISPRSGMMSFKKKPIIIHPQSARGQRPQPPINYSTTQTQTLRLRRRRVFLPHPPSDGYGEEEGQNEFYEEFYEEEEFFEEEINEKESDHIHKEEETLSENENENFNEEETLSENENNNHDEEETKTETEKNDSELISESTKRKEEELASKLLHEEYDKVGEPENDRNDFDSIASKAKSLTETSDSLSTLNPSDEEYRKNREERIANAMKISEADKKYCSEEERYKNSEENNISQALRSESEALKLEEERRNRLDRLKQIEESEELRKRLEESELRKNEESEYAQQKREREEEERKRREMEEEERRRREEEERKRREMEEEERRRREEEERRRREEEEYRRKQFEGEDIMNRGLYDESDRLRDLSDARKMESDARREESDVMKLDSDANKMESDAQTIEMLKSTRINMLTGPINQNEKDSDGSIDDDFVV